MPIWNSENFFWVLFSTISFYVLKLKSQTKKNMGEVFGEMIKNTQNYWKTFGKKSLAQAMTTSENFESRNI